MGAKWDVAPNLAASAAVYQLDRKNIAIANPFGSTQTILVVGQRSEGLELGLSGAITLDWSIVGGYAYQDAKITRTQTASIKAGVLLPRFRSIVLRSGIAMTLTRYGGLALG